MEIGEISYENTRRMQQRCREVTAAIAEAAEHEALLKDVSVAQQNAMDEFFAEQRKHLNKEVYDFAERNGMTLWDVCMNYMPKYGEPVIVRKDDTITIDQGMELAPMPLDFERGPGYWKAKYFRLKEKLQQLIDEKED